MVQTLNSALGMHRFIGQDNYLCTSVHYTVVEIELFFMPITYLLSSKK